MRHPHHQLLLTLVVCKPLVWFTFSPSCFQPFLNPQVRQLELQLAQSLHVGGTSGQDHNEVATLDAADDASILASPTKRTRLTVPTDSSSAAAVHDHSDVAAITDSTLPVYAASLPALHRDEHCVENMPPCWAAAGASAPGPQPLQPSNLQQQQEQHPSEGQQYRTPRKRSFASRLSNLFGRCSSRGIVTSSPSQDSKDTAAAGDCGKAGGTSWPPGSEGMAGGLCGGVKLLQGQKAGRTAVIHVRCGSRSASDTENSGDVVMGGMQQDSEQDWQSDDENEQDVLPHIACVNPAAAVHGLKAQQAAAAVTGGAPLPAAEAAAAKRFAGHSPAPQPCPAMQPDQRASADWSGVARALGLPLSTLEAITAVRGPGSAASACCLPVAQLPLLHGAPLAAVLNGYVAASASSRREQQQQGESIAPRLACIPSLLAHQSVHLWCMALPVATPYTSLDPICSGLLRRSPSATALLAACWLQPPANAVAATLPEGIGSASFVLLLEEDFGGCTLQQRLSGGALALDCLHACRIAKDLAAALACMADPASFCSSWSFQAAIAAAAAATEAPAAQPNLPASPRTPHCSPAAAVSGHVFAEGDVCAAALPFAPGAAAASSARFASGAVGFCPVLDASDVLVLQDTHGSEADGVAVAKVSLARHLLLQLWPEATAEVVAQVRSRSRLWG